MALKIIYFDIKEESKKFFEENLINDTEAFFKEESLNPFSELTEIEKNANIISVFTTSRVGKDVLEQFPNLKLVALRSVGYNHVDLEYCKSRNILVANAPHYGDNTVAEYTFGLMLDITRHISRSYADIKQQEIHLASYRGIELFGKTLGIIGLGAIGKEVARIANGFKMNILAYDPIQKEECKSQYKVQYTTIENIAYNSDIITIHAPSNESNYHLINEDFIHKMKPSAFLINTARGEIVDSKALYRALSSKKIAGAALDVIEYEEMFSESVDEYLAKIDAINIEMLKKTIINNNLTKLPNFILTPHIAFNTQEAIQRTLEITLSNIKNFISGDTVNIVNQ